MNIPDFFKEMLLNSYDIENVNNIVNGLIKKKTTLRVNKIKSNIEEIKEILNNENIKYKTVSFYKDALILEEEDKIRTLRIYKEGKIYLQSLSSMIPPIILEPKENDRILDMTAAPGGKTCQIASITNNNCYITAVEKNKIRADRLKYNLDKQSVKKCTILNIDATKIDDLYRFDKILLDAPCSGSGTLNSENINNFSKELVNNSIKTQEQLLIKALNILKPGSTMVYSTCSILKEENEEILNKVLNKFNVEIIEIDENIFKDVPLLPVSIKGTICVCPNELYEGFFIAKIKKNN
ncbi:MAG: RsmB/NOP family class I SAM-dependent RNA methyltransferase [Firmicutes bacterium]|nr:RsmB/NOP family class I SAM-dependent RNA methyltransferase [Bacillota bacterium]